MYLRKLENKYLVSGPAPLGRILNYIKRIKLKQYTTSIRGPRTTLGQNLDNWTVCFMVGLNLINKPLYSPHLKLSLTREGEAIYLLIGSLPDFPDTPRNVSSELLKMKSDLLKNNTNLYKKLRQVFLNSDAMKNLATFLRTIITEEVNKQTLEKDYGKLFGVTSAYFNRVPSSIQIAQFCDILEEKGSNVKIYDKEYIYNFNIRDPQDVLTDIIEEDLKKNEGISKIDEDEKSFLKDVSFNVIPEKRERIIKLIKRNKHIVKTLKKLYNGECQICGYTFKKKDGENYSEGNHLIPLGESGSDSIANLTILCSNCHSELTYANIELDGFSGDSRLIKINGEQKELKYKHIHLTALRENQLPT